MAALLLLLFFFFGFSGFFTEIRRKDIRLEKRSFICQSTSGTIVQQLTAEGFIDEYLFVVTPVVLGAGKPLFQDVKQFPLELLEARGFHSGNVLLHYSIDKKSND
jgi:dihydrofolate reductase